MDRLPSLISSTRNRLNELEGLIVDKAAEIKADEATEVQVAADLAKLLSEAAPFEAVISAKSNEIDSNQQALDKVTAEWVGFNKTL